MCEVELGARADSTANLGMVVLGGEAGHPLPGNFNVTATIISLTLSRTEKHGDRVSAHTRPGGVNGTNGSPGTRPSTYLTGGKTSVSGFLVSLVQANFVSVDPRAASRSRSFVVTYQRLPTQAHIAFKLSNLTLSMRTKTPLMNPASTFSFTTSGSKMLEACHLLNLDLYICSFKVPNSSNLSLRSLSSCHDPFNQDRKLTYLVF